MSEAIPEKTDHRDDGPMQALEYAPECIKCFTTTFVVAVGKDGKWNWSCTNCVIEMCPHTHRETTCKH